MSSQTVNIRQAYVARPGYYFMDFDYSQIEFRLSAAIAGEKTLIKGFYEGNDYYTMIYDSMFGTSFKTKSKISATLRKLGKEISLGQNYGQEAGGLAHKMKVPYEQAKELMDKYWNGLTATRAAREAALQFAIRNGFINTWFGRKRGLPDLYSPIRQIKAAAVRSVWNSVIQGSSADWLKIAMVRVARGLKDRDAHILLTVQDELVVEVSEKEPFWEIRKILLEGMEFKVKGLPVGMQDMYPDGYFVPVGPGYGYDWGNIIDKEEDFLSQFGDRINTTPIRESLTYSFVAKPQPFVVPVIPERQRQVPDKEKKAQLKLDQTGNGMHPIDELIEFICKRTGQVLMTDNTQVASAAETTVIKAVEGPVNEPTSTETPTETSTEILRKGPVLVSQESIAVVQQTLADSQNPPPVVIGKNPCLDVPVAHPVAVLKPENDFTYPCIVVAVNGDLSQTELKMLDAVIKKFPGQHWFYLEYHGKVMKLPATCLCSPDSQFQGYVKRIFGTPPMTCTLNVFDAGGKQERPRVSFA